jgi:hypothetical protein
VYMCVCNNKQREQRLTAAGEIGKCLSIGKLGSPVRMRKGKGV